MADNNTYKHISDEAKYIAFDPNGTLYPSDTKDVQTALSLTAPTRKSTTDLVGVIQLATVDEALAGTDNEKAITPYTLKKRLEYPDASTTVKGILFLASNNEAQIGNDSNKAIVPSSLKYTLDWWFSNKLSSQDNNGVIKIASTAAAAAGVEDTTAMTPLKVKQAIAAATSQIPSYTQASESNSGLVRLATIGQAQSGDLRDGYAISPYTLQRIVGNQTTRGLVQAATQAQANLGSDDTLYISAKGFQTYNASNSNYGTVKLVDTVGTNGNGYVLSSNANVLGTNLNSTQNVSGTVNFTGNVQKNGSDISTKQDITDNVPVGVVMQWLGNDVPSGGKWKFCFGVQLSKAEYPELFAVIGYTFGGFGDVFYTPDMRGLFLRGAGRGKDIEAQTGFDAKGKPRLGNNAGGNAPGAVQAQQIRKHKHVMSWGEIKRDIPTNNVYGYSMLSNYWGLNAYRQGDYDNVRLFTNDGTEIESDSIRDTNSTVNSQDLMGEENRPWNMSVNYIIKVK